MEALAEIHTHKVPRLTKDSPEPVTDSQSQRAAARRNNARRIIVPRPIGRLSGRFGEIVRQGWARLGRLVNSVVV